MVEGPEKPLRIPLIVRYLCTVDKLTAPTPASVISLLKGTLDKIREDTPEGEYWEDYQQGQAIRQIIRYMQEFDDLLNAKK